MEALHETLVWLEYLKNNKQILDYSWSWDINGNVDIIVKPIVSIKYITLEFKI